jgi:hypothetical protein
MKFPALLCLASLLTVQPALSQQQAAPAAQTQAAPPPAAAPASSQPPPPGTLLDGPPVKLKLAQTVSSADAKVNDHIAFTVIEEVRVDNVVVIPKGADAIATVTEAEHKKSMGRAGKLNVVIDSARLADGEKVSLRASKEAKGGGHVGAMTGAIVATSIIFFPAAPLFLFIHGKDITIPQGTEITAFVEGDMHLDMAKFAPVPPAGAPVVASLTGLDITANIPNCDITVDGAFMGNTPSTLSIAPGPHEITISKKGYNSWTRKMTVVPGTMHLNADLDATTATASPAAPATSN